MAFRHALSDRPGPVYLDIPRDVMKGSVDENKVLFPEGYRTEARPQGDPYAIQRAVNLLLSAERPVVIAGSGVWWSQAGEELQSFVDMAKLPLILRNKGRGVVPERGSFPVLWAGYGGSQTSGCDSGSRCPAKLLAAVWTGTFVQ